MVVHTVHFNLAHGQNYLLWQQCSGFKILPIMPKAMPALFDYPYPPPAGPCLAYTVPPGKWEGLVIPTQPFGIFPQIKRKVQNVYCTCRRQYRTIIPISYRDQHGGRLPHAGSRRQSSSHFPLALDVISATVAVHY